MDEDLVVVRTYRDKVEADLARSALEAAGIDSMLQGDSVRGPSPWMNGYDVLVRAEDLTQAAEILDAAALSSSSAAKRNNRARSTDAE